MAAILDGKGHRRPECDLTLTACDGNLRLIRTIKLAAKDRIGPFGKTFYEETQIYSCGDFDDVSKLISSKDKSSAEIGEESFTNPAYVKCYEKILLTKNGSYKVIDFIEVRCIGSSRKAYKELISSTQRKMHSTESNPFHYEQGAYFGEGLLIIESILQLPMISFAEEKQFMWHDSRSYSTDNYKAGTSRSPLPLCRLLTQETNKTSGEMAGLRPVLKTASYRDKSPPGTGLRFSICPAFDSFFRML
ncbi:unnamed protein product [Gongylonema pulchrum]|uniref:Protein kinase domain-containing protein n=1 Tax=Gongylonema pulchrum TaxID=637853 RepID=A0A183CWV0_9BILA|nr:unnamed protein product [Gongylonema pulchrum]